MLLIIALLASADLSQGCASPRSQIAMNRCAAEETARADTQMTLQWRATIAYMKKLDARDASRGGGFGYAAALLASQRAWLQYRDAECVIEGAEFAGGSGQPMAVSRCRTRLTVARTRQLGELAWRR